jgi:preprotein translocase SecE subunit
MSIAVQPTDAPPISVANPRTNLVVASLVGSLFVLGGLFLAGYVIPSLWERSVAPVLKPLGGFFNEFLRIVAQLATVVGVIFAGTRLAGNNPPKGLRGGIFLCVSIIITVFFVVRAVGLNLNDSKFGPYATLAVLVGLIFASYKYLLSDRAEKAMYSLEDSGWFYTHTFKRTQGLKVRRYTLLGVLTVGWTGAYALYVHKSLGIGPWKLPMPFGLPEFVPLTPIDYAAPFLLGLATFWFAWRLVNVPVFADFLIATEAEMNKVSWSTRRRLYQDTIVVLVTLAIMTLFLFVVDIFWGWLLSRSFIGVLPSKQEHNKQNTPGQKLSW